MKLKKYQRFLLSLICGLLLSLGWTQWSLGVFLFLGFIPLFIVEDFFYINQKTFKAINVFWHSYIAFFIWNIISTWWIYNSTFMGVAIALIFNSLFMAIVFFSFHISKRILGEKIGYLSLLIYWIAFEYLHLNWELSWPWLTLGNGFSNNISIIQWYEFTGVLGGSLWILILNISIYLILKQFLIFQSFFSIIKKLITPLIFLLVPIIISLVIYYNYKEVSNPVNIVVLQPNIDPYNEKFGGMSAEEQINKLLKLAEPIIDTNTNYIIGPETFFANALCENYLEQQTDIKILKNFIKKHSLQNFVIGTSSYKIYSPKDKIPISARKFDGDKSYYDSYNTAIQIDTSNKIQIYHKSQLVLGVEKMPYPKVLGFLEDLSIELGGTSGTLGTQNERTTFKSCNSILKIAPVICYESIFGEYVTEYIKNGANLIFIITNDGWWGNTAGYKQHLSFARLRAIENRRSIARSANTGISCFIDQRGNFLEKTSWWEPKAIKAKLNANNKLTFYTKYGDYIGILASYTALIIILILLFKSIFLVFKRRNTCQI